jgi:hypothetical protein
MTRYISQLNAGRDLRTAARMVWMAGLLILASGCTTIQSPDGGETTVRPDGSVVVRGAARPEPPTHPSTPAANAIDDGRARALAETISRQEQEIKANEALLSEQADKIQRAAADVQALEARVEQGRATSQEFTAEAEQSRQAAGAVAAELEKLVAAKTAVMNEISTLTAERDKEREQLASLTNAVAERRQQLAALDQQRGDGTSAVAAAKAELVRVSEGVTLAAKKQDDLISLIAADERRLIDLDRQIKIAQAAAHSVPATQPTTQQAALLPPVTTPVVGESGQILWMPWAIGGAMAALIAGLGVVGYTTRKAKVYTFTLMDETTKASHRVQVMPGDRVELGGMQPVRKSGTRNAASAYLAVDRKGRLSLHAVAGAAAKLNDRQINMADAPLVTAGNLVEVNGNGQTKRLLVGPIVAVNQGAKVSAKPMAASIRPV